MVNEARKQGKEQRARGKGCNNIYRSYYSRLTPRTVRAADRKVGRGSGVCGQAKRCAHLKKGESLFQKGQEFVCG